MSGKTHQIKPWEDLTIADDYMFKLVMRHSKFCRRLIEEILDIKIRHINYLENEKALKFRYTGKGIRLDVYVEGDDTIYDIEMQVRNYGDTELAYRTRYYQSMIDVEDLAAGTRMYSELRNSFIIFLCPFALFDRKRHMYTFCNICRQDRELELNDGTTKIFLCSDGTLDDVSPHVRAFLDYMKGLPVNDEFINEVDNFIKEIKIQEAERKSYMTYEMKLMEAHNDGKAEGRAEGLAEGRQEGKLQATIEFVTNLLTMKMPYSQIAQATNLTVEEVEKIAKEHSLSY